MTKLLDCHARRNAWSARELSKCLVNRVGQFHNNSESKARHLKSPTSIVNVRNSLREKLIFVNFCFSTAFIKSTLLLPYEDTAFVPFVSCIIEASHSMSTRHQLVRNEASVKQCTTSAHQKSNQPHDYHEC